MTRLPWVILAINENRNFAGLGRPAVWSATFPRVSEIGIPVEDFSVSDECRSIPSLPKITQRYFAVGVPELSPGQSRLGPAIPGLAVKGASFCRFFKVWLWISGGGRHGGGAGSRWSDLFSTPGFITALRSAKIGHIQGRRLGQRISPKRRTEFHA
jgi:hypothetical protein